jgi:hypothetical protein
MGVLAPGTMLGGCRIEAVLGRGGMGVVYRAHQVDLDRDVAVKVIAPELVEDAKSRTRFLTEARAAGAVEHPNVIPVHGAGIEDGRAYLVMRFVDGDDLRAIVQRGGPLAPAAALGVLALVGAALDAIHRAGYVHRDVKPRNVMLDDGGHAYLGDFGLAKEALTTTGPTTAERWVGTLDYVAPEQIRGDPVDARTDVYALGGVLYFMLTGQVPFERDGDHAKLWAHLHDEPPQPSAIRPDLAPELDAVVRRALAKDPADRQSSAGELVGAARAALTGDRASATTVSAGAPLVRAQRARAARGHSRRALAGAALALLTAAGVVALLLLSDGDERTASLAETAPASTPSPAPARTEHSVSVGTTIPDVGFRPNGVAVAAGRVWVTSSARSELTSIDAATGDPDAQSPYIGPGAAAITRDREILWIASRGRNAVVGVNARKRKVTRLVRMSLPAIRVAAGPSGLWVVGRAAPGSAATLYHYDREGGGAPVPRSFPQGISAIALGGGFLWAALENPPRVVRVTADDDVQHGGWLGGRANALAYGAGALWASVEDDDTVARIAPDTKLSPTKPGGRHPAGLVVHGGRVFVADNTDDAITILDGETGKRVLKLDVPSNPWAVAAGRGHVWVTGMGGSTLTRLDL